VPAEGNAMARPLRICVYCLGLALLIALPILLYDRGIITLGVGATNLDIRFVVTDAASGLPIPDAQIDVRSSDAGAYEGAEHDKEFHLTTDVAGVAERRLKNVTFTSAQSRLRFTDEGHVRVPAWSVRVHAAGFQSSASFVLEEEFGKDVKHIGPGENQLVVPVSLRRLAK
jgi:hypothetical protein